jgi:hypothetical protein
MAATTTTIDAATGGVLVSFTAPYDNAEAITAYKVEVKYNPWAEEPTSCSGTDAAVISGLSCLIPMSALRAAPFNLAYGAAIEVRVQA